jgi:hypothetical protein
MNNEQCFGHGERSNIMRLSALAIGFAVALSISGCADLAQLATNQASGQDQQGKGVVMSEPIIGFAADIEPGHITLKDMQGATYDVILAPNAQIFGKDGKPATLSDLHVGDGFNAQGVRFGNTIRALQAKITDPALQNRLFGHTPAGLTSTASGHPFVMGNVTSIDHKSISVRGSDGSVRIVSVDDSTTFYRVGRSAEDMPSATHPHGKVVSRGDLNVGDMVSVLGTQRGDVFAATGLTILAVRP